MAEMVTVVQNGKRIQIPKGDWEYLKSWDDLASAPQSVKNLARSYGLVVGKYKHVAQRERAEFLKKEGPPGHEQKIVYTGPEGQTIVMSEKEWEKQKPEIDENIYPDQQSR